MFVGLPMLLWVLALVPARATKAREPALDSKTVFQLKGKGTWIESIAARENGDLLFTTVQPTPQLYTLMNPMSKSPIAELIYEFPDMTGLLGITETAHDIFAVVGGRFYSTAIPQHGTFAIWQVDFNHVDRPKITKIMNLPFWLFPNGLEAVPGAHGIAMLASSLGSLHRVNLNKGTITLAARLPEMRPTLSATLPLGINGIKIRDGFIYWTNSFASTIYRLPIAAQGLLEAPVTVETVTVIHDTFLDDFVIGTDGTFWAATNPNNTVVAVQRDGKTMEVVVGTQHSLTAAGAVAAVFGRLDDDQHILYVATSGGMALPVNGTVTEPAKVIAIDTKNFAF